MTASYPKRLIEVDLPIKRISAHARREKSIRHGHISTLHIWWARRPLAACRAVVCAALWPDPADPLCPQSFRDVAARLITEFARKVDGDLNLLRHVSEENRARWGVIAKEDPPLDPTDPHHQNTLRFLLLDFIADFANWDNSTVPLYLVTSRGLTQAAHEALGGAPGTRPLVVDPFAGGGSIPLEALRIGADAFASDLNPVAVLLNKVVLEYTPRYGQELADQVRKWGAWVKEQAGKELAEFYPKDPDGATPIAYLWARTVISDAPTQGDTAVEIPLIRSLWVSKGRGKKLAYRWVRDKKGKVLTNTIEKLYGDGISRLVRQPQLELFEPQNDSDVESGTSAGGSATCPLTSYTMKVEMVRSQMSQRRGGAIDSRLIGLVTSRSDDSGRQFRLPCARDAKIVLAAGSSFAERLKRSGGNLQPSLPEGKLNHLRGFFNVVLYGMLEWKDLYTERQLLALSTFVTLVNQVGVFVARDFGLDFATAIQTCLALAIDQQADRLSSLARWDYGWSKIANTFGRQALPMIWDFAEANPFSGSTGDWDGAVGWVVKVLEMNRCLDHIGTVEKATATQHPLPDNAASAIVTDPPYYSAVPYADLSDFFYTWLKKSLDGKHRDLLSSQLTPKAEECVSLSHRAAMYRNKDAKWFEQRMEIACREACRVTASSGVGVFVFASKETAAWEAMLAALINAGWVVTSSWPIDTEMSSRLRAQDSAVLASSIHIVARPRHGEDVGDWRDVLHELPVRIHGWLPRLAAEGVVGADAIFSCLGPALEVFSRYSRVEKASGDVVALREYLEQVWAAVSKEALSLVFRDPDASGLEPDARITAMWLWTVSTNVDDQNGDNADDGDVDYDDEAGTKPVKGGFRLEFDAARKIAQGLGANLEALASIVEVKGQTARLMQVNERAHHLFGKEAVTPPARKPKKSKPTMLPGMEDVSVPDLATVSGDELGSPKPGTTVLDRVHQAMLLFGTGRAEALKTFVAESGAGTDARFWKLAQSLSALYPAGTDEKRWVDGVLARKKGLGF